MGRIGRAWMVGLPLCWSLLLGGVPAGSQEATTGYLAVQRAFLKEDFSGVAALAPSFLTQQPGGAEAVRVRIWLALSLDRLQQANEALQQLYALKTQLAAKDPMWAEVLFWEGDIARRASQMVRAKLAYERLLANAPNSSWAPQAQLGLGLVHLHQQLPEAAIGFFHALSTSRPDTAIGRDAAIYEALCHLQLQQYEQALVVLEPIMEGTDRPDTVAQAAVYLGEALTGVGRFDDAVTAYQRAIARAPEDTPWGHLAQFGIGWAQYRAGQCGPALKAFEEFLSRPIADHRTAALFAQGSCLMQTGREDEALVRFHEVYTSRTDPGLALESGLVLVDAAREDEEYDHAKTLVHEMLRWQLGPVERAKLQLRLGSIALDQGNPAQAMTVFRLASDAEEPSVRQIALSGLADVEMFMGHYPDAKDAYERAIQVDPAKPLATYGTHQLGRIQLEFKELGRASELFRHVMKSDLPRLADDARLALALTYLHQEEPILARAQLDALRSGRKGSSVAARAGYYLTLMELSERRLDRVEALCREAIEGAPRSEEALESRLLLADLMADRESVRAAREWLRGAYEDGDLPWRHRARLAKHLGDLARGDRAFLEAVRWYEIAGKLLPTFTGEAGYWIASCYEEAGQVDDAIARYRAVEQAPWRVRAQLAAAKLLERQERYPAAIALYEGLAREPIPEAKIIQERLAALQKQVGTQGGGRQPIQ